MPTCARRSSLSCLLRRPDPARAATFSWSRIASLALIAIAAAGAAQAATTFNIATTSMANAVDGQCTLVEALAAAQADATVNECVSTAGPYTINLSPGTYSFTASTHVDVNFGNSAHGITAADLTVNGGGATLNRSGPASMRLFYVGNFRSLTLRNLTISGFNASLSGQPLAEFGGAIGLVQGTINVEDSTFSGNTCGFAIPCDGTAILAIISTVNIHRSTFANNDAANTNAAQVRIHQNATLNIANSTFQGARIAIGTTSNSTSHMSSVTLAGQDALIFDATGTANVRNSLLPNGCSMDGGTVNLVNTAAPASCGGTAPAYNLLALAGNGGPTQTRGILVGEFPQDKSPGCTYASAPGNPLFTDGAAIATDQRGFPRDANCDLGAVELLSVSALTPFAAQYGAAYSGTITASGGGAPITFAAGSALPPGLSISAGGVLSGTPTAVGTYTFDIVATDSGGFPSTRRYVSFPVGKADQVITFGAQVPASRPFAPSSAFTISPLASADSGLPVNYSSGTTGVCLVSGTTVTMVSVGTCTIRANQGGNANYNAAAQVTQDVAIDAVVPDAPTIGTATAGNTQVSVAFTVPAFNGGSAILDYTATCGSQSLTGPGSPLVVTGLTNGTPYTCTVVARNAVGTGPASAASNSVTPVSVPFAPSGVTATAGNAQVSVAFTPGGNGGSAILDFTATCGSQSATGAGSPLVVTGLANGTAYTCTVTARNALGTGPASAPSSSVTPATIPGAPTIGAATPGNTQISVAFTAPASDGGSVVLDYTATCGSQSATGPASPITVSGLVNGTAYTCTVVARNAVGTGPASAASNSATPVTVPFAPTGVTATAGNAQISVAFTPGASGGSPILDFTATCGSQSATGAASPLVVTGLVNGTAYTCTVTARNATGTSAPSTASNSATPTTNAFSGPSPTGTGTITATFSGGGPTCTYTVSRFIPVAGDPASPPTVPPAGTSFPHGLFDFTTAGCAPGSTITMTITYPQPLLTGTQYWKYGPTPSNPTPHWYVLPATITGNSASFTITDGQLGDDDLAANGTIVDQGGPGVPGAAVAVPTLSEWAMLLLASLVMFAGMGAARRRS